MYASVLIEYTVKSLNRVFDYIVPNNLKNDIRVGHKVVVSFSNKLIQGFVVKLHNNYDKNIEYLEIKEIVNKEFNLSEELLLLGDKMSKSLVCSKMACYQAMLPKAYKASIKTNIKKKYDYYITLNEKISVNEYINNHKRNKKEIEILNTLINKGSVLRKEFGSSCKGLLNKNIILINKKEVDRYNYFNTEENKNIILNKEQKDIYNSIISCESNDTFLLHGVTGSGKTEIYIKLIDYYKEIGKNAIVLVPEISLTPQMISKFKSKYGKDIAVLHSGLNDGERYDEYRKIISEKVSIVVGARSAIFAPLKNIGIIIIDECQSSTYKQEKTPKYNAIDIALERCKYHNAKCILGSATPLLEQYARGLKGVYKLETLDKRVSGINPETIITDMNKEVKKRNFIISDELNKNIRECLNNKHQAIILLNRRGYSTFLSCSNCGYVHKCPNCDISLIYYKSSNSLACHYCGYRTNYSNTCPKCKENSINDIGLGTEKLEQIIKEKYPGARVLRMDHDTTRTKNAHAKIIDDFKKGNYDILVGTQMVSKGHNFNNVTLVGVINIDMSLNIPDFRSGERTFELLMQTGGRVARYNLPGKVIIQTFNPDHFIFKYIKDYNYKLFYNNEMIIRKKLGYPPYYYLSYIKIISENYEQVRDEANKIKKYLDNNLSDEFIILGPSIASLFKINNKYHFGIIIKYKKENNLLEVLNKISDNYSSGKIKVDIDMNPYNLF